jgi:hypothetical protein
MAFNVRCFLSGLCAYVPDRPLDPEDPPEAIGVIMPNAMQKWTAYDSDELKPHFPMLVAPSRFVKGANLPPNTEVVWFLERLALRFDAPQGQPADLKVVLDSNRTNRCFSWAPSMKEAAPAFSAIDPSCFKRRASKDLTSARLILKQGELASDQFRNGSNSFRFSDALGSNPNARSMAGRAVLEIRGVKHFHVKWYKLDEVDEGQDPSAVEETLELEAGNGKWVEFEVGNLCNGCMPARFDEMTSATEDRDFRWYYKLCKDRNGISKVLKKGRLLPFPAGNGTGGPGAIQCMGAVFDPDSSVRELL